MNLQTRLSTLPDLRRISIRRQSALVMFALCSLLLAPAGHAQLEESAAVVLHDSRLDAGAQWTATRVDLDEDGAPDLILGLPDHDRNSGRVIILYGPDSEWPERIDLNALPEGLAHEFRGELPGDRMGHALLALALGDDPNQPKLLIGAPGARNPDGLSGSGSVYVIHGLDRLYEYSTEMLDGQSGYRILAGSRQDGLGSNLVALDDGPGLPVALSASPWSSFFHDVEPPYRPAYWPGDTNTSPVQSIGHLAGLSVKRHQQRLADGREFLTLPPANGRSATILSASTQTESGGLALELHPSGLIGTAPQINFGDGIADQYVLAGELMTLDFVVSDDVDPPEFLNVNASFLSTPLLIDFQSLALSGTGTIRTLVAQTLTGFPDGSENLEVSVTNSQGVDAVAPFEVFVLNSSIPEINGGLGLADQTADSGDLLEIPFTATDLLFDAESLTYQATSSDQTLLPDSALLLNGDGSGRLLSIQTAPGQGGQTTISVEVTNPLGESAVADFVLTINTLGGTPAINGGAGIGDQVVVAGEILNVPFQVSDPVDLPQDLVVTAQSDNPAVIDNASLSLIGTTQNRALRIQTLPGQTGLAGITVEVANLGGLTASADFSVSVIPRSPPLINFGQGIPDRSATAGDLVEINLSVSDQVDPPGNLLLTAESLEPGLVPDEALQVHGTGTSRILRIATEPDQTGTAGIRLTVTSSAGLSTQASFNLELTARDGPVINDGAPLPDRTLPPDQISVVEFVIRSSDGQPGDFELRVFSSDQDVLPDDALRLDNDGPDWTLEIDTSIGRPGTTQITVEARQPDGGVSQTSFELTINPASTELAIESEVLGQRIGDQRLARLVVENSGAHPAFDLRATLVGVNELEVTGTWSQASGCSVNDGEVGCEDLAGAAWQCQDEGAIRTCRLDQLLAESTAVLIVAVTTAAGGQLEVNADAANADAVTASLNPGD